MINDNNYSECINNISEKNLMEGLFLEGFFPKELPPIFQTKKFYDLFMINCNNISDCYIGNDILSTKVSKSIIFQTMRYTNIPRNLNIPNPFLYFNQCMCLTEYWDELQNYFSCNTFDNKHKISQVHIFNMKDYEDREYSKKLINNNNTKKYDFKYGFLNNYKVNVDISRCFPSIYTHSISWALYGKEESKNNKHSTSFGNLIDKHTRNLNDGETYGIPVGPHSSYLISEIILTKVDFEISKKWKNYIRYVDDYICYVSTEEEAQNFIRALSKELSKYNLSINHRKTKITKLPIADDIGVTKLQSLSPISYKSNNHIEKIIKFPDMKRHFDIAKDISIKQNNVSIIKYAIKMATGKSLNISKNAQEYLIYEFLTLSYLYPYLIPLIGEYIIERFNDSYFAIEENKKILESAINKMYNINLKNNNFEAIIYCIYYSLEYDLVMNTLTFSDIKDTNNSMVYLFGYLYANKFPSHNNTPSQYQELAKQICILDKHNKKTIDTKDPSFQENWLFIYEVLEPKYFPNEWSVIKKSQVSFLIDKYIK